MPLFHVKHPLPFWAAALAALAAGGLFTLAFVPYHQPVAAFAALGTLMGFVLSTGRSGRAFLFGWLFGVAHHATALGWIANALLVDTARFSSLVPLAKLGIPAVLALYIGAVCGLTVRSRFRGLAAVLLFAALWTAAEYARSYLLLPFPWNLTGYVWSEIPILSQVAALFGTPGLGLLTVLVAGGMALLLLRVPEGGQVMRVTAICGLLLVGYGVLRLVQASNNDYGLTLRLVQPNVAQSLKWDMAEAKSHFQRLLRLSQAPSRNRLAAIIWPESAVPWRLDQDTAHRLAAVSPLPTDAVLITGVNRWEMDTPTGAPRPYNSLFVFDRSGATLAVYDKHRLVPFGEYVPLRWLFNVEKVAGGAMMDFAPGTAGVSTIARAGNLPSFSPLICYEGIYPGAVARRGAERPQWLLNITNDAWFGRSAGPYQHLAMTRMRAIEEGLSVVRVANSGITAVIDPWGRILVRTGLEEERVVDVPLPSAIAPPPFARFGNAIPAAMVVGAALLACLIHLRSRYAAIPDPALSPVPR